MRKLFYERNYSNTVHVRPMHQMKVNALDDHQYQPKCTGFESFLEQEKVLMH